MEKVYEISVPQRGHGHQHNPEFTMMEVYQAYTDYKGMMDLTESDHLLAVRFWEQGRLNTRADDRLSRPWTRMTMTEAVLKYSGVDFDAITSDEALDGGLKAWTPEN